MNDQTETYVNDAADKLTSISIGGNTVRSFTYDGRGRRKTDTYAGTTRTFSWDAESRLVGLTNPGLSTSYGYNGLDARTSRTVGANTTTYKRAGAYVTDPVLNETTGQFSANYTPGVSERRAGVSTYLHSGLKNADARTTDGSAVTADRQYDAFGNLTGGNGTWNGPFGYAGGFGYQEDGESVLKLLGHRYYDSTTGRFLSKDPIGDGRNWYSYCDNNPLQRSDPDGLQWLMRILPRMGPLGAFAKQPWFTWRGVKFFEKGVATYRLFKKHWQIRKEISKEIAQLEKRISKSKSPKERKELELQRRERQGDLKGHEKEMDQKWKGWRDRTDWDSGEPPSNGPIA